MIDAILVKNEDSIYDIVIENGDLKSTDGLDTAILVSMLTDGRASSSQVSEQSLRRGWIGNEQNTDPDFDLGSKRWLLDQAALTQKTVNDAISFDKESFEWMLTDGLIKDLTVTATSVPDNIITFITFLRFNNETFKKQFELWENTTQA